MKQKVMIMAVGMLMACLLPLAAYAQQETWRSTSTMQGTGSAYAPQVAPVGASTVADLSTTTGQTGPSGPRKAFDTGGETGRSDQSPIGDAVLPLMVCAVVFCGVIALRRKRSALSR